MNQIEYSGYDVPHESMGAEGDTFIQTDGTNSVYEKIRGVWKDLSHKANHPTEIIDDGIQASFGILIVDRLK